MRVRWVLVRMTWASVAVDAGLAELVLGGEPVPDGDVEGREGGVAEET